MDKKLQQQQDEIDEKDIIKDLVSLGFPLNDARVYFSLLKYGPLKPVKISEICGVDRSRVYDSLRRLTKKAYVQEEPVKRGPMYKAHPHREILSAIRKEYRQKNEISTSLEKNLDRFHSIADQPYLQSVKGKLQIFKEILHLIADANEFIKIILTPDFSMSNEFLKEITNKFLEKKRENSKIHIEVALNHPPEDFQHYLKTMDSNDISVYLWYIGNVLPYGLYISEKSYIFTILSSIDVEPSYNIGIMLQNAKGKMVEGFKHLFAFNASYFVQGSIKEKNPVLSRTEEKLGISPEKEEE